MRISGVSSDLCSSGRSCFYNMGWFIDALPNGAAYLWHTGSVSGFRCCHYHALAGGVTAMMFLNVDSDAIGSIGFDLIEAVAPGTPPARQAERRVGKECGSTYGDRGAT